MSEGVVMKILRNNDLQEKSLIDPVGKFRVCEPQTLIDTDFEYGLQTTKWETLELVNNIPTFYARDNDEALSVLDVTTVAQSYNIYVTTSSNHELILGTPVIVVGVNSFSAEGAFVVNSIVSSNIFVYKAKALQPRTESIYDNYSTNVYVGKLYQGTQYNLDALGYIKTSGSNQIIIDTLYPHGFSTNTNFILSKSVGQKQLIVARSNVDTIDTFTLSNTIDFSNSNTQTGVTPYTDKQIITHEWQSKITAFFDDVDVNFSTGTITSSNHGFSNDEYGMYVPEPYTLSNVDASYQDEINKYIVSLSNFKVASFYDYTFDGTSTSINTGGSNMFGTGVNNVHYIGTATVPSFALPYANSNWVAYDSTTDYRTFGTVTPFTTVVRHTLGQTYYYRIEIPVTGAQAGSVHERNGSYTALNHYYCRWNYFGLYNNAGRPSFYYLIASFQALGSSAYPTCSLYSGTATTTTTSLSYTYQIANTSSYHPTWTVVMLQARTGSTQITQAQLNGIVNNMIGQYFPTFGGLYGEYRYFNMFLWSYANAGDYYINDGGNGMFDNNNLGNILSINNTVLSYRDKTWTGIPNFPHVEYRFLANEHPQIMVARQLEQKWVEYRIQDTWAVGSGTTTNGYWYNMNEGGWYCTWGFHGLHSRASRASVYRIFMSFTSTSTGYPSVNMAEMTITNTRTVVRPQFYQPNANWPCYTAIILLSQQNGGAMSQTYLDYIVRCVLRNSQYMTGYNTWSLPLIRNTIPFEQSKFNNIGGLVPYELYQVNVLNSHQFQLMDVQRGENQIYFRSGNFQASGYWGYPVSLDISIDITTNYINFGAQNGTWNSYVYLARADYGSSSYCYFVVELIDNLGVSRYSNLYVVTGGSRYFYFNSNNSIGNINDPMRRYTTLRIRATSTYYHTIDYLYLYFNDPLPAFRMPTTRTIKTLTAASARAVTSKHALMKSYRIHFLSSYYFYVLRESSDQLLIAANDPVYLFQHPDISGVEIYANNNTASRQFYDGWPGPGVQKLWRVSYDNIDEHNYNRYTVNSSFVIQPKFSYIRLNLFGSLQTGNNNRWWPGTSWLVVARDIPQRNTLFIPNHGITTNTAITYSNLTGKGIRELVSGQIYYASVYDTNFIRLKPNAVTSSTIDFSYFDGSGRFTYTLSNPNRDTVYIPDHGLSEGAEMVYTAQSNVITPLQGTNMYYAINVTRDRFRVSTDKVNVLNLGSVYLTEDVSLAASIGSGSIIASLNNVSLNNTGSGTGSSGGFSTVNGFKYLMFNGASAPRQITSKVLNTTNSTALEIYVISGNNVNGGEFVDSGKDLYVYYSYDQSTWNEIGIIAPATTTSNTWSIRSVLIPPEAQSNATYLRISQNTHSGTNNDNFGIQYIRLVNTVATNASSDELHYFAVQSIGAVDGTYVITGASENSTVISLTAPFIVPPKTIYVDPRKVVNLEDNTFYLPYHRMKTGATIQYNANGNSNIDPLVSGSEYFATRIDENHIRIAATFENALAASNLLIENYGSGSNHTLIDYSVGGEITSSYFISGVSGCNVITGSTDSFGITQTTFTSEFKVGNILNAIVPNSAYDDYSVSSIDTNSYTITLNKTITFQTGDPLVFAPAYPRNSNIPVNIGAINPLIQNYIYYANVTGTTTVRLYDTYTDALNNTNVIQIGSGTGYFTCIRPGQVYSKKITEIRNDKFLVIEDGSAVSFSNCRYFLSTNLFVKADGFALHRPFDGGVEMIPPKNSDSQMIRQTRKYFRYQSGKGIQVSLAINFSAPVDVDQLYREGFMAYVITKRPHRLSAGVGITIEGATENGWNGSYTILSIDNDNKFGFMLTSTPDGFYAPGLISFYVNQWNNSFLRGGLYDDQNGLFFEYDGSTLYAVRRNSVQQLAGSASVVFNSPVIDGTLTSFESQLDINDMIVIRGQSYKVVSIESDTRMYIQPVYRGITRNGVVITKTIDLRVPQHQFSIDHCDGTGPTGYNLNIHRTQMAYIDYSWYGAGKVRFGFKDRYGDVRYVHEFIHNNYMNEAYLRSGNLPCRYEVVNRGYPTYVPALMHWGTSVIMDGRFDDDKAYLFTAAGQLLSYQGNDAITVTTNSINNIFGGNFNNLYYIYDSSTRRYVYCYAIYTANSNYDNVKNIRSGTPVSGTYIQSGTLTVSQPTRYSNGTVIYLNKPPTQSYTSTSTTLGTTSDVIPALIPLISIRLAPSVDNSKPGALGAREVLNRMQLILKNVGLLTTHDCEIKLLLNGSIDNRTWTRVTPPSLSQLVYHAKGDNIDGGTQIFNFRIPGGSPGTTGKRTATSSTYDLEELVTLGNSILGGDAIYPDGPDLLTIAASILDLSDISSISPFTVTARVTWTESQA